VSVATLRHSCAKVQCTERCCERLNRLSYFSITFLKRTGSFLTFSRICQREYKSTDWGCLRTEFWEEYLDLRGMRWRENGGNCTMRNLIICTHPLDSLGGSSQSEWGGQGMWHAWERRENCARFWWGSPKERDHSQDQGIGGRMGSEWILRRMALGGGVWIGFNWFRIGTGGGLLWMRW
jgi:hypothetical protein